MKNKIDIVTDVSLADWDNFCVENGGNIFQSPYFYRICQAAKGYIPHPLFAVQEGRILASLLPVEVRVMPGLFNLISNRIVLFGGALYQKSGDGRRAVVPLFENLLQRRDIPAFLFGEVRNFAPVEDIREDLAGLGIQYYPYLNYVIDLTAGESAVFNNIQSKKRQYIRKIARANFNFREAADVSEMTEFYGILKELYRRKRLPLADISLFTASFDEMAAKGVCKLFLVEDAGRIIGGRVVLIFNQVAYDWYTAMEADYLRYHVNDWFLWEVLKVLMEQGVRHFDFCGAGRPDQPYGVRDFKKKFGGAELNYGRFHFTRHPRIYQAINSFYTRLKRQ